MCGGGGLGFGWGGGGSVYIWVQSVNTFPGQSRITGGYYNGLCGANVKERKNIRENSCLTNEMTFLCSLKKFYIYSI